MYRDFDEKGIRDLLGITAEDTPDALIVHGTYDIPVEVALWCDRLTNARVAPDAFNIVIGEHGGSTVWCVPVLGGPLAAYALHCAGVLGVNRILQIGSFGGTRKGLDAGDLLLVTGAGHSGGTPDWYLARGVFPQPDAALNARLRDILRSRGLSWHEGPVFSTPAFMAETRDDVLRWEAEGYAGVEMEAATTFAVAQHFGVPSAALIHLIDNLIEEHHILAVTSAERERARQTREQMIEVALACCT